MRRKKSLSGKILEHTSDLDVRFSDVDSMAVVWHGHYVRYFEDGREAWGKRYGLSYLDVYKHGFFTPIVKMNCEHKKPLVYGDEAIIETKYLDSAAAKLLFEYKIYRKRDHTLVATGETTQVFLDRTRQLCVIMPKFVEAWKEKWNLL